MNESNARQKKHWDAVAGGWADRAEWTECNFAPIVAWLARATGWRPGARILDVACGAGFPALAAAAHVAPTGAVVAADISAEMRDVVARRARDARVTNVEVCEMDAEDLRFEDASFDAVTNVYGLMFCADPQRALAESRRVLAPLGRCGIVVWAEPDASPFFGLMLGVAAQVLAMPPPRAGAPGPFRFAAPAELAACLRRAGFTDVVVDRLEMTFDCGTPDEYLAIFRDVAWKARLEALSEGDRARLREAVYAAAQPYLEGGQLRLSTTSLCAAGSR